MYRFVIFVLYFSIVGLFLVCCFALNKWKSKLHTYLFFSAVSNLVYNTGCLIELHARDEGTYVAALKLGYLGRLWVGFSLVLFVAELCGFHLPDILKIGAAVIHFVIYISILNLETSDLYYNYMEFTMDGEFPKLLHSGGPLYYLQTAINLIYVIVGWGIIIRAFIREKKPFIKQRYLMMTIALLSIGSTYIIYFFKLIPLAHKFDVMIIGYAVATVFMLIGIVRYGMLDPTTVAKNYVVDELSEAVIVVDAEDNIAYCNNPARDLFPELAVEEKNKDVRKTLTENLRSMTEAGDPVHRRGRIYTPRSNRLTAEGNQVGTLYTFSDDSEHYRHMDELKAEKRKADDANRAKSQFLANMSHEIRTPINAVLGFNDMILTECADAAAEPSNADGPVRTVLDHIGFYAGNIQRAGGNLLSIINDILDLSKIEAGRMEITDGPYRLGQLFDDVSSMIAIKARDKGLSFVSEIDPALPDDLSGDVVRIRQVMTNILSNAVKYTDKGSVTMHVRGEIRRETGEQVLSLSVEVRDTGIGIRREDMDMLFSKFQRLDMNHNSTIEGTGLGLAISRELVTMMGGTIDVDSIYGSGSVFTIRVPQKILSDATIGERRAAAESDTPEAGHVMEPFTAPDARILLVDDTELNLVVAKGLLQKTQIRIDTAESGEQALRLTAGIRYDLILMDQRMPEMDGTETMTHIRAQEDGKNRETPVICMTADAIIGAKERYLAEGFTDYLSKPVDKNELALKISKYLPQDKIRWEESGS